MDKPLWERRGRSLYAAGLRGDYLITPDQFGWKLSQKAHGDQGWSLVGYYPSEDAARAAVEA